MLLLGSSHKRGTRAASPHPSFRPAQRSASYTSMPMTVADRDKPGSPREVKFTNIPVRHWRVRDHCRSGSRPNEPPSLPGSARHSSTPTQQARLGYSQWLSRGATCELTHCNAQPQSITSSAYSRMDRGIASPNALAVLASSATVLTTPETEIAKHFCFRNQRLHLGRLLAWHRHVRRPRPPHGMRDKEDHTHTE